MSTEKTEPKRKHPHWRDLHKKIVAAVEKGSDVRKECKAHCIGRTTFYRWRKELAAESKKPGMVGRVVAKAKAVVKKAKGKK